MSHVHGLTIGELARYFASLQHPPPRGLQVIPMLGWRRRMLWPDTGLPWIPPSPNLPTVQTAAAYPVTVFLEATTIAEGRGTTTPFLTFGAPFLSSAALATALNAELGCVESSPTCARAAYFEPTFQKYNGTVCGAVQWLPHRLSAAAREDPFLQAAQVLSVLMTNSPAGDFVWDGSWFGHPGTSLVDMYAGTPLLREMLDAGTAPSVISQRFQQDVRRFSRLRQPFLLYD